ncbi:putative E3 ubiquitin-protein ligase ORTHRUS 2 [Iris pallida]|uniref:E3 ubiquitin-protein ligase ORTHRUS 2 n=1 Tax=Iris pallida TaxID=29817 RepID=A0AAX6FXC1_IRIPA|nr:putative E3 ubiquitin-protein ligase ORTHRUS 2 [Iris pallida]
MGCSSVPCSWDCRQSKYGAQSVALSEGYEDDEDHGEWFLYTGSGGRDLSGNKRTNKHQAFDQKFEKLNQALRVSCMEGYLVRVVRSFKEKRSSYAPEKGVRYDGIYRIEKCWQKIGIQGFKVCRYLFVRCDNEPAPWASDEHGDRPRPLPVIKELKGETDVTERKGTPSWDYDEAKGWTWMKPPPISRSPVRTGDPNEQRRVRKAIKNAQNTSIREQLLKEFSCLLCRKVMVSPLTTPCGHNFCKYCLMGAYSDPSFVRERGASSGRSLRAKKIVKKCPSCPLDISDFLENPQVNRELMDLIESLKRKSEEEKEVVKGDKDGDSDDDGIDDAEEAENQDASGDAGSEKLSEIASVKDKKSDVDPKVSQDTELEEEGREGEAAPWKRSNPDVEDHSVTRKWTKAHAPKQSPKKAKTSSSDVDRDDSPSSLSVCLHKID